MGAPNQSKTRFIGQAIRGAAELIMAKVNTPEQVVITGIQTATKAANLPIEEVLTIHHVQLQEARKRQKELAQVVQAL